MVVPKKKQTTTKKHHHSYPRHRPRYPRYYDSGYYGASYYPIVYTETVPVAVPTPPVVVEAPVVLPEPMSNQRMLTYAGIAFGGLLVGALIMSVKRQK